MALISVILEDGEFRQLEHVIDNPLSCDSHGALILNFGSRGWPSTVLFSLLNERTVDVEATCCGIDGDRERRL